MPRNPLTPLPATLAEVFDPVADHFRAAGGAAPVGAADAYAVAALAQAHPRLTGAVAVGEASAGLLAALADRLPPPGESGATPIVLLEASPNVCAELDRLTECAVAVLIGVGAVGEDPLLDELPSWARRTGRRLTLLRDLDPALGRSRVAVLAPASDADAATALDRLRGMFAANFDALPLARHLYDRGRELSAERGRSADLGAKLAAAAGAVAGLEAELAHARAAADAAHRELSRVTAEHAGVCATYRELRARYDALTRGRGFRLLNLGWRVRGRLRRLLAAR